MNYGKCAYFAVWALIGIVAGWVTFNMTVPEHQKKQVYCFIHAAPPQDCGR